MTTFPIVEIVIFHIAKSQAKDYQRGQSIEINDPNYKPILRKEKFTILHVIPKRSSIKIVAFRGLPRLCHPNLRKHSKKQNRRE